MSRGTGTEGQPGPRAIDRALIAVALGFATTSLLFDRMAAIEPGPIEPATGGLKGAFYWYASTYDPLIVQNPLWLQIMSGVSAFVFGPFYLLLAYALWRRRAWIRLPALAYASVMLYSMVVFLGVHSFGEPRPPMLWLVVLVYLPYVLFPIALLARMLPGPPFAADGAARP